MKRYPKEPVQRADSDSITVPPALDIINVHVSFKERRRKLPVLNGLSLTVQKGSLLPSSALQAAAKAPCSTSSAACSNHRMAKCSWTVSRLPDNVDISATCRSSLHFSHGEPLKTMSCWQARWLLLQLCCSRCSACSACRSTRRGSAVARQRWPCGLRAGISSSAVRWNAAACRFPACIAQSTGADAAR